MVVPHQSTRLLNSEDTSANRLRSTSTTSIAPESLDPVLVRPAPVHPPAILLPDGDAPLPERFVLDTCFLMNLSCCPLPRQTDLSRAAAAARRRWDEYLARKAQNPQMRALWSPAILREFHFASIRSLVRTYQEITPDSLPTPAAREFRRQFSTLLERTPSLRAALHTGSPTPAVLAAVLPLFQPLITALEPHMTLVQDVPELISAQSFAAYWDLIATGLLTPDDAMLVLTARSAGAQAILTDDPHLTEAAPILAQRGLQILS
jgi:hypothetical protein